MCAIKKFKFHMDRNKWSNFFSRLSRPQFVPVSSLPSNKFSAVLKFHFVWFQSICERISKMKYYIYWISERHHTLVYFHASIFSLFFPAFRLCLFLLFCFGIYKMLYYVVRVCDSHVFSLCHFRFRFAFIWTTTKSSGLPMDFPIHVHVCYIKNFKC